MSIAFVGKPTLNRNLHKVHNQAKKQFLLSKLGMASNRIAVRFFRPQFQARKELETILYAFRYTMRQKLILARIPQSVC